MHYDRGHLPLLGNLTYFTRSFRSSNVSRNGHQYTVAASACC